MKNAILFILFYLIALLAVSPTESIFARFVAIACLVAFCGLLMLFVRESEDPPRAIRWLRGLHQSSAIRWLGAVAASLALIAAFFPQKSHIQVEWFNEDGDPVSTIYLEQDTFEIVPSNFDDFALKRRSPRMVVRATFRLSEPVYALLLHSSHGQTQWRLNGQLLADLTSDNPDRYLLLQPIIDAGVHHIECLVENASPPPMLSVMVSPASNPDLIPLSGPFYRSHYLPVGRGIHSQFSLALGVLAILAWTPTLNTFCVGMARVWHLLRWPLKPVLAAAASVLSIWLLSYSLRGEVILYEADEAAFGLMAQRLLQGEAPPLFHYGQQYQGVIEVFPLAMLMAMGLDHAFALKLLPILWSAGFMIISAMAFWRWGSSGLGVYALIVFALAGSHFYWILSKAWFGYSFTLFCGAILMWISLQAIRRKRLTAGWGIGWGVIAGVALYALPIVAPFVAISGLLLIIATRGAGLQPLSSQRWNLQTNQPAENNFPILRWTSVVVAALANWSRGRQGVLLAGLMLGLTLFPYWGAPWFETEAVQYLAEGRSLPSPRTPGENPLTDRFIDECLPTLLGARAPYDQQKNYPETQFPAFPSLLFLFGAIGYPWLSRGCTALGMFTAWPLRWSIFLLGILTAGLVSFAPFGVWPWYAIPLYWIAPLIFYVALVGLHRYIPAAGLAAAILWGVSMASNHHGFSDRLNNPSSLSYQGLIAAPQFEETIHVLRERGIRYVICDQGFDVSPDYAGRDWLGECLTFASNGEIIAIDRLSRRIPDAAQEVMNSARVAYLFHQDFFYNNPGLESVDRYIPLTKDSLQRLFSSEGVRYDREEADNFTLYLPPEEQVRLSKQEWHMDSNHPIFLSAAKDHNISVRAYGRDTYWSSGYLPPEGGWLRASFPEIIQVERIVLFHGTKSKDYPHDNTVVIRAADGQQYEMGALAYNPEMRASILTLPQPADAMEIEIRAFPPEDHSWMTVFQMWVVPPAGEEK